MDQVETPLHSERIEKEIEHELDPTANLPGTTLVETIPVETMPVETMNPFVFDKARVEEAVPSPTPKPRSKQKFTLSTYNQLKRLLKDEILKVHRDIEQIGIRKDAMDHLLNHLEEHCSKVLVKAYKIRILNKRSKNTKHVVLTKASIQSALL